MKEHRNQSIDSLVSQRWGDPTKQLHSPATEKKTATMIVDKL